MKYLTTLLATALLACASTPTMEPVAVCVQPDPEFNCLPHPSPRYVYGCEYDDETLWDTQLQVRYRCTTIYDEGEDVCELFFCANIAKRNCLELCKSNCYWQRNIEQSETEGTL